ncbi:MAG: glycosyltransferase [Candidatus Bathyarchaeia archaeon]
MRLLLVPTTDWLQPPAPTRLHHVFERVAARNEVHVLRFRLGRGRGRNTRLVVHEPRGRIHATCWPPTYYLANSLAHMESLRGLLREYDFDVMVLSNLLPAYAAARSSAGEPCLFDLSDHFPLSGVEYLPGCGFLRLVGRAFLEALLRKTLKHVDLCVASSTTLAEYGARLGARMVKLIANGVDESFLSAPFRGDETREKYGLKDSLVVGFLGAVRGYHNFEPLLGAMKRIAAEVDVKLLVVGPNRTLSGARLRRRMQQLGLTERLVQVTDLPASEVPYHIDVMDICTIPLDASTAISRFLYPNKLWEYLARARPVAATPLPEILREAGPFIQPAQTEQEYVDVFRRYGKKAEAFEEVARLARVQAKEHTWSKIAAEYEELLHHVVAEST